MSDSAQYRRERRNPGLLQTVLRLGAIAVAGLALLGQPVLRAAEAPIALSSAEKQAVILEVLERFVPHAESFWRPSDLQVERTGRYEASGRGVSQPRGVGGIAMAYATLLKARPKQAEFSGVPRGVLVDHLIQSIRHEVHTNRLVAGDRGTWGGNEPPTARRPSPGPGTWQGALETYQWGFAAWLLWERLDLDTRDLVRRVVTGEADLLVKKPPADARPGNTGAEDNAWNTPPLALAVIMFPDHPHTAAWRERAKLLAMNSFSRPADRGSSLLVDGRAVRDWMQTSNFQDDYTLDNHGFFNPLYITGLHHNMAEAAVFYAQGKVAIPEAFSFRMHTIWHEVLGRLVSDDGDVLLPAGQDWVAKDYQHLPYLTAMATRGRRADASVAESRALTLVARRQLAQAGGSLLGQKMLGYETSLIQGLAAAWWMHESFGPAPQPTASEFARVREQTSPVREFTSSRVVVARQRDALVTMSWNRTRPMGLIVPAATGHDADPVFSSYAVQSAIGSARGPVVGYATESRDHYFSAAGTVANRSFSMTSFADGVTLLLDRGEGRTFEFSFEHIPGLTGARPVSFGACESGAMRSVYWANVADRFGLLVAGGTGMRVEEVSSQDPDLPNPRLVLQGSTGTGTGNRGAMVVPLASVEQTEGLGRNLVQPAVPEGWSALLARAPDHSARLAVARWSGPERATLALSDSRGAPVVVAEAVIEGKTGSAAWNFARPGSTGAVARFFVDARGKVAAIAVGEQRISLANRGDRPVSLDVVYVADDGKEWSASRSLDAGETAMVQAVGDSLKFSRAE